MRITKELLRKKAEHHDGILPDLNEISLHQLEIEEIEVVGSVCRKLQILYLQNNIIGEIKNLAHCKDLRYLNLALNNITTIKGLSQCEFLHKLDLTANFIDLDEFENSMEHLKPLLHLKELFCMGCPFQDWPHHRDFVIACLPQLVQYDGAEIVRSDRIKAKQSYAKMLEELRVLSNAKREEKGLERRDYSDSKYEEEDDPDSSPWTPEERTRMYREMAEQKAEKEKSKSHMEPKKRDYEKEQEMALERAREREEKGEIRQCNEGRWDFHLQDEDGKGNIVLTLPLPRYLDNSLLHVDCHPSYVTIIIKGKVLRLRFPEEVSSDSGSAQRNASTGELVLTLPKLVKPRRRLGAGAPSASDTTVVTAIPAAAIAARRKEMEARARAARSSSSGGADIRERTRKFTPQAKLGDELLAAAAAAAGAGGEVEAIEDAPAPAEYSMGAGDGPPVQETPYTDADVPPLE